MAATVSAQDIRTALGSLGLGQGDTVLVHSALSSLGQVEGGAKGLVQALLDLLGPAGTLVVPTLPSVTEPFDPETSPSTVGRVSEVVRLWPGALRSRHPTHAVSAVGAQA